MVHFRKDSLILVKHNESSLNLGLKIWFGFIKIVKLYSQSEKRQI